MSSLHERIKQSRHKSNLSQANLAALIGVTQPTIANWEIGSHIPRKSALKKICKALNVSEEWLLSGQPVDTLKAINAYLFKPVRHVPIYVWPEDDRPLQQAEPQSFFPFASERQTLFGIQSPEPLPFGIKIYVFDKATGSNTRNKLFLWQTDAGISLEPYSPPRSGNLCLGKLICELSLFETD